MFELTLFAQNVPRSTGRWLWRSSCFVGRMCLCRTSLLKAQPDPQRVSNASVFSLALQVFAVFFFFVQTAAQMLAPLDDTLQVCVVVLVLFY
jgi:hypothetical protein